MLSPSVSLSKHNTKEFALKANQESKRLSPLSATPILIVLFPAFNTAEKVIVCVKPSASIFMAVGTVSLSVYDPLSTVLFTVSILSCAPEGVNAKLVPFINILGASFNPVFT